VKAPVFEARPRYSTMPVFPPIWTVEFTSTGVVYGALAPASGEDLRVPHSR
jgi:hypothetical protein